MTTKNIEKELLSSLKSTSVSTSYSDEDSYSDALFPDCDHLHFVKKLSEAKFPVYLVSCSKTDRLYAIKLFYWENDEPSPYFLREVRFAQFNHPNVIQIVDYKEEQELYDSDLDSTKVSYILMEYTQHGDFFDALVSYKIPFNEVLVRTYFHQLIEGVEALHAKGAAHLDLKLENLLMSHDYNLKLIDFDLSYMPEDIKVKTRGTKHFRAPEIAKNTCTNPYAADIYSAGIILFLMKTGGMVPYKEAENLKGMNMIDLKETNPQLFWEKQCDFLGKRAIFFSEEFKDLFMRMTKSNPKERPTVAEIKKSSWYNMEICSQEELSEFMSNKFGLF